MEVTDVHAEFNRRGIDVAYSTVAGWFNGSRGERWKVNELKALLDVLQTDLDSMTAGEAVLVQNPVRVAIQEELEKLSDAEQQAYLALLRSRREGGN